MAFDQNLFFLFGTETFFRRRNREKRKETNRAVNFSQVVFNELSIFLHHQNCDLERAFGIKLPFILALHLWNSYTQNFWFNCQVLLLLFCSMWWDLQENQCFSQGEIPMNLFWMPLTKFLFQCTITVSQLFFSLGLLFFGLTPFSHTSASRMKKWN